MNRRTAKRAVGRTIQTQVIPPAANSQITIERLHKQLQGIQFILVQLNQKVDQLLRPTEENAMDDNEASDEEADDDGDANNGDTEEGRSA